jgi:hypothetical protein
VKKKAKAKKKPIQAAKKIKSTAVRTDVPKRAIIARQWNVTEAQLTNDLSSDLLSAWKKLRAFAADLGPQQIYASAQSIMFARKVCYFYVRPKKTSLEVWIFLPRHIEGLTFMQGPAKKVKYCNLFKVTHVDQVEEPLTDWLREAYV